jgi:hypothetical protein
MDADGMDACSMSICVAPLHVPGGVVGAATRVLGES